MKILYLDKYRGFQDSYIRIKNVNFLVGENSTGKSSILSLIRVLTNQPYGVNLSFFDEEVDLGYFSEICTYGEKEFSIGVYNEEDEEKNFYRATTFKFVNSEDIPRLKEVHILNNEMDIKIVIKGNKVTYTLSEFNENDIISDDIQFFKLWNQGITSKIIKKGSFLEEGRIETFSIFNFINEIRDQLFNDPKTRKLYSRSINYSSVAERSTWIGPIRAKAKKVYDSYGIINDASGGATPYILRNMQIAIHSTKSKEKKMKYIDDWNKIIDFGINSGMFDALEVNRYLSNKSSPFEINISLNGKPTKMANVGYGVSQILPIVVDIVTKNNPIVLIQQPEVHLHPKAQAEIGAFIFNYNIDNNNIFIIETHSDYTIDRFRICQRKSTKDKKIDSQVMYFERCADGNRIYCINIDENGDYDEDQPENFREFFIREEMELLGL